MCLRTVTLAVIAAGAVWPHDVITTRLTWSNEISRIVYKRCASCHRAAGSSMPLLTYTEARPWAKAIKEEVLSRQMPPWGAVKGFGSLRDDPSLTQEEIDRVAQWVEGGAPEGDERYLPAPPDFRAEPEPGYRRGPLRPGIILAGLAPRSDIGDARITAELPGGRILPLLWLHEYKARWKRAFVLAEPVELPPGSRIRIEPPTGVDALTAVPRRQH